MVIHIFLYIKSLISESLDMQHCPLHFVAEDTAPQRLRNCPESQGGGSPPWQGAPRGVLRRPNPRRGSAPVCQARRWARRRLGSLPGSTCTAFWSGGELSSFSSPGLRLPASLSHCLSPPGSKSAPLGELWKMQTILLFPKVPCKVGWGTCVSIKSCR